jgi:hypothetical protein
VFGVTACLAEKGGHPRFRKNERGTALIDRLPLLDLLRHGDEFRASVRFENNPRIQIVRPDSLELTEGDGALRC